MSNWLRRLLAGESTRWLHFVDEYPGYPFPVQWQGRTHDFSAPLLPGPYYRRTEVVDKVELRDAWGNVVQELPVDPKRVRPYLRRVRHISYPVESEPTE